MNIEKAIDEVADNYVKRGYTVVARPTPDDLPDFAKSFDVQLVGKLRDQGVVVAIKRNRDEFSADPEMDRIAEIVSSVPNWRFDFVLLEDSGRLRGVEGAQELSEEQLRERIASLERRRPEGHSPLAFISAWAVFEAAMRRALRATGQPAGWGTNPRQMMNELVSNGIITMEEFSRLQEASRTRNTIVHGFEEPQIDAVDVTFLLELAHRLIAYRPEPQPA